MDGIAKTFGFALRTFSRGNRVRSVNCLVTGIAVLVLGLGESARAQTPQQLAACNNSAAPEAQIAGCTALIKSGKYSGRNLAIVFNNRCNAHNRKGAYDLAINDCNQALKLDPNYVIAYSNRCIIYYNKNDYDRAIAAKPSSATRRTRRPTPPGPMPIPTRAITIAPFATTVKPCGSIPTTP